MWSLPSCAYHQAPQPHSFQTKDEAKRERKARKDRGEKETLCRVCGKKFWPDQIQVKDRGALE